MDIIEACGKEPESTTQTEMDAVDARLMCLMCRSVMTWRTAVRTITLCQHT